MFKSIASKVGNAVLEAILLPVAVLAIVAGAFVVTLGPVMVIEAIVRR